MAKVKNTKNWVLTTMGSLIISLILLEISWKVQEGAPVKSFLHQTTHSKVMLKNPNLPYMSIIG